MTGKEMLKGIQNLDAGLIEEAEFAPYPKRKSFGKKKLLLLIAAVLIMGTMTAATVYTRWSATMQMGSSSGIQPSEQIKKQAEKTGLSVTPTETKNGKQKSVSATDNGITVTAVQTLADQYGGVVIFRIKGLKLEEGQLPWVWFDFLIDGQPLGENDTVTVTCLATAKQMATLFPDESSALADEDTWVKDTWRDYVSGGGAVLAEPENYITLR